MEENNIDGLPTLPNKSTGGSNPDEAIVYFWTYNQKLIQVLVVKPKKKFCNRFSILKELGIIPGKMRMIFHYGRNSVDSPASIREHRSCCMHMDAQLVTESDESQIVGSPNVLLLGARMATEKVRRAPVGSPNTPFIGRPGWPQKT